ncbi:cell division cycle protein 20 homolog B [Pteropus medius]|uniref:cell division cycle protein 20 homolog B n=1 Tax=Pteropus vampyrus TaxID=132908 RepID=UPI00196A2624|nr:cell division cycle protein 20 homolog B [Pteropus giganteus]
MEGKVLRRWRLERTAPRKVRTEEEMMWENVMQMLSKGMKQKRSKGSPKLRPQDPDLFLGKASSSGSFWRKTSSSSDESEPLQMEWLREDSMKRLSAEVPVASSPITTRWRQSQTGDLASHSFGEEHSTTDLEASRSVLKITPDKETLILGSYDESLMTPIKGSFETNNSTLHFCKIPHALDGSWKENIALKGQKYLNQLFSTQKVAQQVNGKMQLCEQSQRFSSCLFIVGCRDGVRDESFYFKSFSDINYSIFRPEVKIHLTGLRNDYYLNILDWNFQNLVAVALGSSAYIWNGETHNGIENVDLRLTCNYVSSVSWIKEGNCLAVGTSEGEVQLWDVVTKKRLRNMLGHLSVVGALSWNHSILSSGSRLGRVYHHNVRVAQHHVGTLHHKQAVCALKWSPDGRLLSSGCSDGLLTIWPHDPGVTAQSQPIKVISHPTAVKICSLIWLPKTKEIATGQGTPKNDVTVWTCSALARSGGFFGHRGRVLHLALSPDQTQVFSAAADGTACVWNCC